MRDKVFFSKIFKKLELIGVAITVLLFLSLLFIESRNHSSDRIANKIQLEVNKEYSNIKSSGEKFLYYKNHLASWSSNDIPLPSVYSNSLEIGRAHV